MLNVVLLLAVTGVSARPATSLLSELRRRLAVDDAIKETCSALLETYYDCAGVDAAVPDDPSYAYADDQFTTSGVDFCAEAVAAAAQARTPCGDVQSTCRNAYLDYASCYVQARCGVPFECDRTSQSSHSPGAQTVVATVGFYNVDPLDEAAVCFKFGTTTARDSWQNSGAVARGGIVYVDLLSRSSSASVMYYEVYDAACEEPIDGKLQVTTLSQTALVSWGTDDAGNGRASAIHVASDGAGVSAVFLNQVSADSTCEFSWRNATVAESSALAGPISASQSRASTHLTCDDVSRFEAVRVTCDGQVAELALDPKEICPDTTLHFVALPENDLRLFQAAICSAENRCEPSTSSGSSGSSSSFGIVLIVVVAAAAAFAVLLLACGVAAYRRQRKEKADVEGTPHKSAFHASPKEIEFTDRQVQEAEPVPEPRGSVDDDDAEEERKKAEFNDLL